MVDIIEKYAKPLYQEGDFLALSEKVIAILQGRIIHRSEVKISLLARFLTLFIKKWDNGDPGFRNPPKVQVALDMVGTPRMLYAAIVGGIMKFVFRQPGWFYRIVGNDVRSIDGFNPHAMPPYNDYAMLGPENPVETAQSYQDATGIPCAIIDANNINVDIMGVSDQVSVSEEDVRLIVLDNPMGQDDEQTPLILIRKK
ncbi:MAG: F420-0--gamma-glutamyl ligase [Patescibacteria group bacterium]|nr:F420-0--gamma-glutamyl ligase [Patescibacteria group bacterium]